MATDVVTCFLRNRGAVLLTRRAADAPTYPGRWAGVSGLVEDGETPEAAARRTVAGETGLGDAVEPVRSGGPLAVEDADCGRERRVHPFLFDCDSRAVADATEHAAVEWVHPPAIRRRETVPGLWRAYRRVAPTVRSVAADADHGSAYLSVRALEVLRDRAGLLATPDHDDGDGENGGDTDDHGSDAVDGDVGDHGDGSADPADDGAWAELADLARRLRGARPEMTALANRVDRAMAAAAGVAADADAGADTGADAADPDGPEAATEADAPGQPRTPRAVERAAIAGIERALAADEAAAAAAADLVDGRAVLTLSRSGTVLSALRRGDPGRVYVAESRPAREGVAVASALAESTRVTLHTDAAVADVLARRSVDLVLVGADAVRPDGGVVNKTGTRAAAVAAAHEGVDCYAVAASDKVATGPVRVTETAGGDLYDGAAAVETYDPLFDETPPSLVTGVVTERGTLDAAGVGGVAEELRALAAWDPRR